MKKKTKAVKVRRRRPGLEDLAARKAGAKGGATRAATVILPYVEQNNAVGTRSGRIGSLAVDPSDPSLDVGGPEMAPHTPHTLVTPRRSRGALR